MCSLLVSAVLLCLSAVAVRCQRYIVPEATLQLLSPRGLRISIPDIDPDVTLVAFHININEEFYSLEHGQWAQDIIKKRNGTWTYYIPDFKVKQGDTIYYWIYVIVDRLGYQGLDRSYKVTQANPHGQGPQPDPPVTPPTDPVTTPSTDDRGKDPQCLLSLTSYNQGFSTCHGQVILDKVFNNMEGWSHEVHIGGSHPDDEFTVFTKDSGVCYTDNGNLVIKPTLMNDSFVATGTLTMKGCTTREPHQCTKTGVTYLILPPVMSARLTSRHSFTFRYGTVEIVAKLPRGDWIVPELWLEPTQPSYGARSGRIVVGLSRGNIEFNSADNNNWVLEAGVIINNTNHLEKKTQSRQWSQDYHTYKLFWTQDVMKFSVDNQEITRLPSGGPLDPSLNSGALAPFDKEFHITLGVHVGGRRDFPDGMRNKPWKNSDPKNILKFWTARNSWHSTWTQDSVLRIKSIRVTAL